MSELGAAVFPILRQFELAFKVVRDKSTHYNFNNAMCGLYRIGKIVTIYLDDSAAASLVLETLLAATNGLTGPSVLTDFRIGEVLYLRYGSYENSYVPSAAGDRQRLLLHPSGQQIPDVYCIPAQMPPWIENPYAGYIDSWKEEKKSIRIHRRYYPVAKLKSDLKGDVIKCAYFGKYRLPKFCILKQGRIGMYNDKYGRDMKDILLWQYEIGKKLKDVIPMPSILEAFVERNTECLAMEFIPGESLLMTAYGHMKLGTWFNQSPSIRTKLLDYLLQVITATKALHQQGYVHRDITGQNFLVAGDKVVFIDLELIFCLKDNLPDPPFIKGTEGFMSPNQADLGYPEYKDDIFAFGALLIQILTGGIDPTHIIEDNRVNLREKLSYLLLDDKVVDVILSCLSVEPRERPEPENLVNFLVKEKDKHAANTSNPSVKKVYETEEINHVIESGINSLFSTDMTVDNHWFSTLREAQDWEAYPLGDKHFYRDIHRGMAGVLYFLQKAIKLGYNLPPGDVFVNSAWDFIRQNVPEAAFSAGGLHFGATGIGLLLSEWLRAGLSVQPTEDLALLRACFDYDRLREKIDANPLSPSVIFGIAGDGLAALQCSPLLGDHPSALLLSKIGSRFMESQQKDGSWLIESGQRVTGFGYGIAGVVYFLLEYHLRSRRPGALEAAIRGLDYLCRVAVRTKSTWEWYNADKGKVKGFWWCRGGPGIALTFLKAYEVTGERRWMEVAEMALRVHPPEVTYYNLSQCHGMAGLGEIYLEAKRVTGNPEWQMRADWIAGLLCALKFQPAPDRAFWICEENNFPTADLMVGSSGILHFLLRYVHPDKVFYPLLPEPLDHGQQTRA